MNIERVIRLLRVFLRNKMCISIFAALLAIGAFSTGAAAYVTLRMTAPDGVNLTGINLSVYPGTSASGTIKYAEWGNASARGYSFDIPGTYNYRVTGPSEFITVVKLFHFTQAQIDSNETVEMEVRTARKPTGTEPFGPGGIVYNFTDQIEQRLLGTAGLTTFPAAGLQTPTFTTSKGLWQVTTQSDMMSFIQDLEAQYPNRVRTFNLGNIPTLNYQMPIVFVSKSVPDIPSSATLEQATEILRANGRAKFLHQGSIHGNEQSATEGALYMIREMAGRFGEPYLDKIDFICVPRINVEGGARWTRANVYNSVDMNRDHIRLQAPEIQQLHKAYLALMPEVTMDGHEIYYYAVTSTSTASAEVTATQGITDIESTPCTTMNHPLKELVDYSLNRYAAKLFQDMGAGGLRVNHYENGNNGWTANNSIGRTYYGLMGSVSFLIEVRGTDLSGVTGVASGSYVFERRAWSHVLASKSLLQTLYDNLDQTRTLVAKARKSAIAQGKVYEPGNLIYLNQSASGNSTNFRNTGIEEPGAKYTSYKAFYHQATMAGDLVTPVWKSLALNDTAARTRPRPTAYIVPKGIANLTQTGAITVTNTLSNAINYDYLLGMLDGNGIYYYEIPAGTKADVRQYCRTDAGNTTNGTITADLLPETEVTFANGAYVIPLDQVAGAVAVAAFEPDMSNSNGFNASVAQTESGATGLAVIIHDFTTRNYPYYRLESNDPRMVLPDPNYDGRPYPGDPADLDTGDISVISAEQDTEGNLKITIQNYALVDGDLLEFFFIVHGSSPDEDVILPGQATYESAGVFTVTFPIGELTDLEDGKNYAIEYTNNDGSVKGYGKYDVTHGGFTFSLPVAPPPPLHGSGGGCNGFVFGFLTLSFIVLFFVRNN